MVSFGNRLALFYYQKPPIFHTYKQIGAPAYAGTPMDNLARLKAALGGMSIEQLRLVLRIVEFLVAEPDIGFQLDIIAVGAVYWDC